MTFRADSPLVTALHPAANVESRACVEAAPSLLILHYTGMSSAAKAVDWLSRAESRVSCHYVVDEHGAVTQMVPECMRAWHAGISCWRGACDVNSRSIGIEIQNPGHEHGYPDFPPAQMQAVAELCKDIVARHGILPEGVLAHSDVAPERKVDPGEKFDWSYLANCGIGLWVPAAAVDDEDCGLEAGSENARVAAAQDMLRAYGYDAPQSGVLDDKTGKVLRAFQLHFRRDRVDGRLDRSTEQTLARVLAAAGLLTTS